MAKGTWCLPDDLVDARPGGFGSDIVAPPAGGQSVAPPPPAEAGEPAP